MTPSWGPTRLAGLGVPLAGPLPVPAGEEAAVPDGGDARAGVHGSLDDKHLRRAHRLPLHAQGTLGGVWPRVTPVLESPLPPGAIPMPPLLTPTSHSPPWHPQPDPDLPSHGPPGQRLT